MPPSLSIRRAAPDDVVRIAPLFDGYRRFYEQASDPAGAEAFIRARLASDESVIFLALCDETSAGFTQLYPIFSSVRMIRVWLLNDLYVEAEFRRAGVGRALMGRAIEHARETGYGGVELATAANNHRAKALYEDLGFFREDGFDHYALTL